MDESEITRQMNELLVEYEGSRLSIDNFLRRKLGAARKDGKKCAEVAIATLAQIDSSYAALQQTKSVGMNRQEWLRDNLEKAISDLGADKKRETAGEALAIAIDAIGKKPPQTTPPMTFDGSDAVDIVDGLDEVLTQTAIAPVLASEKEVSE